MIHDKYDVIVVGAGPSGSVTAEICSQHGLRTFLAEKEKAPGKKVCAGGLRDDALRIFKIKERIIEQQINKIQIFCETQLVQELEWRGFTVYRKTFDAYLAKRAKDTGAEIHNSARCLDVLRKKKMYRVLLQIQGKLTSIRSNVIVAADGAFSVISRSFHGKLQKQELSLAVQYEFRLDCNTNKDIMYLFFNEKFSKLGYAWIFPKKKGYTVGLSCLLSKTNIHQLIHNLNSFIQSPKVSEIIKKAKRGRLQIGYIPVKPRYPIFDEGILFVGDAAGQVSPLFGEGIFYAMNAGKIAGNVIIKAIEKGDVPIDLSEYEMRWKKDYGEEIDNQRLALEALAVMPYPTQVMANVFEAGEPLVEGILLRYNVFRLFRSLIEKKR